MSCESFGPVEITDSLQFGTKSIGVLGSVAVLLNNILGPGIANFSGLFQQSGWLPPTLTILLCVVSSVASGDMLLAVMRAYPGNSSFTLRVEYGSLCRQYFGRRMAIFCQCLFQLAMLTANISNIIQTAQVLDYFVASLNHEKSCALMFYPHLAGVCHHSEEDITPFGTGKVVLSIGMGIVVLLSIPLGYYNLDDNVVVQNAALVVIVISLVAWVSIFGVLGLEADRVPAVGTSLHNMGGTILFNFMFISTIPSWICEKKPSVRPLVVIIFTLVLAIVGYILVGVLGGMAFAPYYQTDETLLSKLNQISDKDAGQWVRTTAFASVEAYAISANLASIPIFSILMRYNLIDSGVMGPKAAGALSVLVPFGVSVILYTGQGFKNIVDFSGTFTSAFVNLMVPSLLYLSALGETERNLDASAREPDLQNVLRVNRHWSATGALAFASKRPRRLWQIIAWANLVLMVGLTTVSIVDQYSS